MYKIGQNNIKSTSGIGPTGCARERKMGSSFSYRPTSGHSDFRCNGADRWLDGTWELTPLSSARCSHDTCTAHTGGHTQAQCRGAGPTATPARALIEAYKRVGWYGRVAPGPVIIKLGNTRSIWGVGVVLDRAFLPLLWVRTWPGALRRFLSFYYVCFFGGV